MLLCLAAALPVQALINQLVRLWVYGLAGRKAGRGLITKQEAFFIRDKFRNFRSVTTAVALELNLSSALHPLSKLSCSQPQLPSRHTFLPGDFLACTLTRTSSSMAANRAAVKNAPNGVAPHGRTRKRKRFQHGNYTGKLHPIHHPPCPLLCMLQPIICVSAEVLLHWLYCQISFGSRRES